MDDSELVRRLTLGDAEAWRLFVERHAALLHAVVARTLGASSRGASEAEDVLQGLFSKLWEDGCRRLATFRGRSRLSTWLAAVARREALDFVRSRGVRERTIAASTSLLAVLNGEAPAADAHAERRETEAELEAALERIPSRDALLVRLVYVDGCPYREAARLLAVPENSISPWLSRARDRLRALLPAYGSRPETPLTP